MQKPMPSQSSSDKTFAFPLMILIAPSAQGATHFPQPVHFSSSIFTIIRFTVKPIPFKVIVHKFYLRIYELN